MNKIFGWRRFVVLLAVAAAIVLFILVINKIAQQPETANGANPGTKAKVIATIGGVAITNEELISQLTTLYGTQVLDDIMKRKAVEREAAELQVTASEAEIAQELIGMQRGYDSEDAFYKSMEQQLGLNRQQLHSDVTYNVLLEKIATYNVEVSEMEVEEYIASHPEEFGRLGSYRFSQIIVETEDEALDLMSALDTGADFAELAKQFSIDEFTSSQGGDYGEVASDDPLVPMGISAAIQSMSVGDYSRPIAYDDHYALILLTGQTERSGLDLKRQLIAVRNQLALNKVPPLQEIEDQLLVKWKANVLDPQFIKKPV